MKKYAPRYAFLIMSCVLVLRAWAIPGAEGHFAAEIYAARRAALLDSMPRNSVAVFAAATTKMRSNDIEFEYRQTSDLLYLTGVSNSQTTLVLLKSAGESDSVETREIFFVPRARAGRAYFVGAAMTVDEARARLEIEDIRAYDQLGKAVREALPGMKTLLVKYPVEFIYDNLTGQRYFIGQKGGKWLRAKFPGLKVKSPARLMAKLRQIKSAEEIRAMQKAVDITCEAQREAMRLARPGLYEYQLEAAIEYVFKDLGAEYTAFPSIVGSGPNSTILHYSENRRRLQKQDMIVMDIGAEYHGYAADVTRTIPANGKFSPAQKEIYEIVLRAQKAAMQAIRPGLPFREVHRIAKRVIEEAGYGKYFTHGTSHYVGLDVHDVGERGPLRAGMVITVEPGIYIKEGADMDPKYWNIGVRIEDDVLVTDDGYKQMSRKAPREVSEIEKLMKKKPRWTKVVH